MRDRESLHRLPLGQSSFETLRSLGKIHVDKTDLILEPALDAQKIFPRSSRSSGTVCGTSEGLPLTGAGMTKTLANIPCCASTSPA